MGGLYISRVKIKNFRNFIDVDVRLNHKQVIIGENNVGKTNFLRAIQLILDQSLSDEDRNLQESDFNETIKNPMQNGEEIRIDIYIDGYKENKTILCVLSNATIVEDDKEYLKISYRFYKHIDASGNENYVYKIFMGYNENRIFGSNERKYLNIKVIKALRDVESEMKNFRMSPIKRIINEYDISSDDLEYITDEYKKVGDKLIDLDEINDLMRNLNYRFGKTIGTNIFSLSLQAVDIDPNKVLSSLRLLMANRMPSDNSLGLNNILYITLMLHILRDKTIRTFLNKEQYDKLVKYNGSDILSLAYEYTAKGNYTLRDNISSDISDKLYCFMSNSPLSNDGVTIIAIEEPEAHLHPIYQRLIYRDVIKNNNNSIILTTHSTHVLSVAQIDTIVNLHTFNGFTMVNSTALLDNSKNEFMDLQRYLDVKRGEIFLGKGVILVEGVAEEYLIPKMAEQMKYNLDAMGIVICNINCTNFTPFVKVLDSLQIPYVIITDGDHYRLVNGEKIYHSDNISAGDEQGYLGVERIKKLCNDTKKSLEDTSSIDATLCSMRKLGFFVGNETFEVDIMSKSFNVDVPNSIIDSYNELTNGSSTKQAKFKNDYENKKFWACLSKIEDKDIGKGRFSQCLSNKITVENIPDYVRLAIEFLNDRIKSI